MRNFSVNRFGKYNKIYKVKEKQRTEQCVKYSTFCIKRRYGYIYLHMHKEILEGK